MKQHPWTLLRAVEIGLFALLILFVAGCEGCFPNHEFTAPFEWRGYVWRIWYKKAEGVETISLLAPNGKVVGGADPRLPFNVSVKDGAIHIGPRTAAGGPAANSAPAARAAASPPYYVYLLSDSPQDALYIVNQQNGALAGTVPLPTLPQGVAVNNSGDFAYVTNQGIEAGNPFFPAAPPRVTAISRATRAVSHTINLSEGMLPGKPVVSPDDRFVYVPVAADTRLVPTAVAGVAIIDAQSRSVVATIPVSVASSPVRKAALTPDGALLFVVAVESIPARVFVLDTFTREQSALLTVANSSFRDLLLDHTGTRLYLLNQTSLVVIDTATLAETGRLTVRANARLNSMSLSLDGGSLFINDEFSTSIVRVDTATLRVAEEITFAGRPAPDTSMLFVVP